MAQIRDEVLYDVRLIERHIRQGRVTRQEVDKRIKALEDAADQSEPLNLDQLAHAARGERTPRA